MDPVELLPLAGNAGRFQWMMFILLGLVNVYTNLENLAVNFLSPSYEHWCAVSALSNLTPEEQKQIAIPVADQESHGYEPCRVKEYDWDNYTDGDRAWLENTHNLSSISCSYAEYTFDTTNYGVTATSQWNLVCEKEATMALISPIYTTGLLIGSFLGGVFSDRFGRRVAVVAFTALHIVAGVATALAVNEWMYMIGRMFIAIAVRGTGISGTVILMEFFSPRHRVAAIVGYQVFFGIGGLVITLFAYFIRHFRYLQGAVLIPLVFMLSYWWIIPESPRWLLARGRARDAADVMQRMARINGRVIPEETIERFVQSHTANGRCEKLTQKVTLLDLLRNTTIRKYSLVCDILLMSSLFLSLGISLNLSNLFGDIYTNVTINSAMEFPIYVLLYFALGKLGRRYTFSRVFSLAGLFCFTAMAFLAIGEVASLKMAVTILHILARIAGSCGICTMGIYIGELFPTSIRQAALGTANGFAAMVGILAPVVGGPMKELWTGLPSLVFGVLAVLAACCCLVLPETLNKPLPETIEDVCRLKDKKPLSPVTTVSGAVDAASFDCKPLTISADATLGTVNSTNSGPQTGHINQAYQQDAEIVTNTKL